MYIIIITLADASINISEHDLACTYWGFFPSMLCGFP